MAMTLTQMRYFQAVCKYENYTKAAETLYVSQPAVSQAIRDLEQECGLKLFIRKGNALRTTEAGQILLSEVNTILAQMDNLNKLVSSGSLRRDFVRVGLSTFSSSVPFPRICAEYHRKYPEYRVMSHEGYTSELFGMLEADRLDLIVTAPGKREWNPSGKYRKLILNKSTTGYCVSINHPWAKRDEVTLEEMAAEPLILISEKYDSYRKFMKLFSDHGLEPNIIMTTSQMFTIERFAEAGAAAGFLPLEIAKENPLLKMLHYPGENKPQETALIWKKDSVNYPAVQKMILTASELYPQDK